jgi:hypothetical protein
MNNPHCELASHKLHRAPPSIVRAAAILFSVTLLSSLSGNAFSKNAVHKCMDSEGHFEFTDKKCASEMTAPAEDKTAAEMEPASAERNPEPPRALMQHQTVINQPSANTGNAGSH